MNNLILSQLKYGKPFVDLNLCELKITQNV